MHMPQAAVNVTPRIDLCQEPVTNLAVESLNLNKIKIKYLNSNNNHNICTSY